MKVRWAAVFVAMTAALPAQAQMAEGFGWMLGARNSQRPGPVPKARVSYRGSYGEKRSTHPLNHGVSNGVAILNHDATASFSLNGALAPPRDDRDWSASAHARAHDFVANSRLDAGSLVPAPLWDLGVGLAFRRDISDSRAWGSNVTIGSASDRPFGSIREATASANAFFKRPARQGRDAWFFLVNYSNNRSFLNHWPLPGVGYWWDHGESLKMMLGLPFVFATIRPAADLTMMFGYFAPWAANAHFSWRFLGPMQAYSSFQWQNQRWLLAGRDALRERLFYDEKKASLGLRAPLTRALMLDLAAGYAFDRAYFRGEKFRDRHDLVRVGAGWVYALQVSWAVE